jgi:predicted nucleic acid-binding protein
VVRLVIDANFAVRWGLPDETDPQAESLLDRAVSGQDEVIAPPHFRAEVLSTFYQTMREGRFSAEDALEGMKLILNAPVIVEEPPDLYQRALELGIRYNIGGGQSYDLIYLALAEILGLPLWTGDARFYRSLRPTPPRVRLVPSTRPPSQ